MLECPRKRQRGEKGGDGLAHLAISSHLLIKAHLEIQFALDTYDTAYGTAQNRMSRNSRIGKYGSAFWYDFLIIYVEERLAFSQ